MWCHLPNQVRLFSCLMHHLYSIFIPSHPTKKQWKKTAATREPTTFFSNRTTRSFLFFFGTEGFFERNQTKAETTILSTVGPTGEFCEDRIFASNSTSGIWTCLGFLIVSCDFFYEYHDSSRFIFPWFTWIPTMIHLNNKWYNMWWHRSPITSRFGMGSSPLGSSFLRILLSVFVVALDPWPWYFRDVSESTLEIEEHVHFFHNKKTETWVLFFSANHVFQGPVSSSKKGDRYHRWRWLFRLFET